MENQSINFKSKVRVAISPICNLKCVYCNNSSSVNRISAMEDFRKRPLSEGNISLQDYLAIFESLHKNGFHRINFTGGEPMLNPNWDILVNEAKNIGFESVEMTTNGTLINSYLNKNKIFPENLDRLIISLDTHEPSKYKEITRSKYEIIDILQGIKTIRKKNPTIKLTANRVLCQSNLSDIKEYIDFISEIGFNNITFLDYVIRDKSNKSEIDFFKKEFLSGKDIKDQIHKIYGNLKMNDGRHAYNVTLPNGLTISIVDTKGETKRDQKCDSCNQYCQEGFYTVKVATDGTIIDCPSDSGISIDARQELQNNTLDEKIDKLFQRLTKGRSGYHFDKFYQTLSGSQVG